MRAQWVCSRERRIALYKWSSSINNSFTSTETRRLVRTDSPGRPPRLSHSSWTGYGCVCVRHRLRVFHRELNSLASVGLPYSQMSVKCSHEYVSCFADRRDGELTPGYACLLNCSPRYGHIHVSEHFSYCAAFWSVVFTNTHTLWQPPFTPHTPARTHTHTHTHTHWHTLTHRDWHTLTVTPWLTHWHTHTHTHTHMCAQAYIPSARAVAEPQRARRTLALTLTQSLSNTHVARVVVWI